MNPPLVIRTEPAEGIIQLTLNRPEKRNALSIELRYELADHLRSLDSDAACSAAVLSGNGPAFCAGMDFTQFGGGADRKRSLFESTTALFGTLVAMSKPVISSVSGAAVGGGFMLALCCDQRIVSEDAFFGFFEVSRGIPAPFGVIRLYVGDETARDWCSTGRRISPEEAMSAGIVSAIVPPADLPSTALAAARTGAKVARPHGLTEALNSEMETFRAALNLPGN